MAMISPRGVSAMLPLCVPARRLATPFAAARAACRAIRARCPTCAERPTMRARASQQANTPHGLGKAACHAMISFRVLIASRGGQRRSHPPAARRAPARVAGSQSLATTLQRRRPTRARGGQARGMPIIAVHDPPARARRPKDESPRSGIRIEDDREHVGRCTLACVLRGRAARLAHTPDRSERRRAWCRVCSVPSSFHSQSARSRKRAVAAMECSGRRS